MFWPQTLVNGTFVETPKNMMAILNSGDSISRFLVKLLNDLGLHKAATFLEEFDEFLGIMDYAMRIPADSDDTNTNMALGALLQQVQASFPEANQLWWSVNLDHGATIDRLVQTAYTPFSNASTSQQLIDPRTYFALREFLEQESKDVDPHFGLFTTWMETVNDDRSSFFKGVAMPYNVNNVDFAVSTNALFGLLSEMIREGGARPAWLSDTLEGHIVATARLLMWGMESGRIIERPDITLLYYPSLYDFFFFVGRLAALMQNNAAAFPTQKLRDLAALFPGVMRKLIGEALWSSAGRDPNAFPAHFFWDDFLGLADKNLFGKEDPSYDDRMFSTSLALTALLDLHSSERCACSAGPAGAASRCMLPDTPQSVYQMIEGAVAFLQENALEDSFRPENAFFSGSSKTPSTCLTCYPATFAEFLNGTKVRFDDVAATYSVELIDAVEGVVDQSVYVADLHKKWFGEAVPDGFHGFNSPGPWPFWSSPPMTHAMELLSLSTFIRVQQCEFQESP